MMATLPPALVLVSVIVTLATAVTPALVTAVTTTSVTATSSCLTTTPSGAPAAILALLLSVFFVE